MSQVLHIIGLSANGAPKSMPTWRDSCAHPSSVKTCHLAFRRQPSPLHPEARQVTGGVDHCKWGAVRMEPLIRMAEAAVAIHMAAQRQNPVVTPRNSMDATRSIYSLRTLMAMPLASPA